MRRVFLVIIFALCATRVVRAQERRIELSPFAGGYFSAGFNNPVLAVPTQVPAFGSLPTSTSTPHNPLDEPNSGVFGVRGSFDLTRRISLEGTFAFSPAGLEFSPLSAIIIPGITPGITLSPLERGKDTFHYHGNILYHWRLPKSWSPFVTGGWGIVRRTSESTIGTLIPYLNLYPVDVGIPVSSYSRNSFSINFGGGVKKYFSDRYGLRFDFRNYTSSVSGDTVNNMEASVGLIFRM